MSYGVDGVVFKGKEGEQVARHVQFAILPHRASFGYAPYMINCRSEKCVVSKGVFGC